MFRKEFLHFRFVPLAVIALLISAICIATPSRAGDVKSVVLLPEVDTIAASDSTLPPPTIDRNWWHLLKRGKLQMSDTTVQWPRFLGFCVKVYNWADRTFNSYDTTYVVGTGRRWKAIIKNDNWLDSYAMHFEHKYPVWLLSDVYSSLGAYLSYMAVSAGYSIDLTNVIGNKPMLHKKAEFQFSCARFSAEAYYNENTGGTYLRRLADYNGGHLIKVQFPGLTMRSYGVDAYYFFNNRRYAQGAAYNFSKIQKRSAGTFIAGISISNQKITVDFSTLPEHMLKYIAQGDRQLRYVFDYNEYCLMPGYSYNWVFAKNFVYNISAFLPVGIKVNLGDATDRHHYTPSLNVKGKMAVVYNLGDFFTGIFFKMDGHWYFNKGYSFFNSIEQAAINVGVRF